jgi:hypothetical protein
MEHHRVPLLAPSHSRIGGNVACGRQMIQLLILINSMAMNGTNGGRRSNRCADAAPVRHLEAADRTRGGVRTAEPQPRNVAEGSTVAGRSLAKLCSEKPG